MQFSLFIKSCRLYNMALAAVAAVSLSACQPNSWVSNAQVSTYLENEQQFVGVGATIITKNVVLPAVDLPILNVDKPGVIFGKVTMVPGINGTTDLGITVNLSEFVTLPPTAVTPTLPNGSVIPVSGLDPNKVLSFSIGGGLSKVYVNFSPADHTALVGVSVVVPQLETGVPSMVMIPFDIGSTGVKGLAGLFTGAELNTSGFAFFADTSAIINAPPAPSMLSAQALSSYGGTSHIQFQPFQSAGTGLRKLIKRLRQLNAEGTTLEIR